MRSAPCRFCGGGRLVLEIVSGLRLAKECGIKPPGPAPEPDGAAAESTGHGTTSQIGPLLRPSSTAQRNENRWPNAALFVSLSDGYRNMVVAGRVTLGEREQVNAAYATYKGAFDEAFHAAHNYYHAPTPENVKALAHEIIRILSAMPY
jgi:hypothetical protein